MTFSLILAWVTVLFSIVTAFKYIARISKCKRLNHIFHKIHIPIGIALVLTGLIHGLLAGNFKDTGLTDARLGTVFFHLIGEQFVSQYLFCLAFHTCFAEY